MRKELYLTICEALKGIEEVDIKHVDLWNRNIEFIEQEEIWAKPAVFVEFGQITWSPLVGGRAVNGEGTIRLHIVTDWVGSAEDGSSSQAQCLEFLDYSELVMRAMLSINGNNFRGITLLETHTNHDHEELVECIEVFKFRCTRNV